MEEILDKGILVVDDDKGVRDLLTTTLKSQGYTEIFEAADGVKCLSILAEHGEEIYLVLLDIMMPGMDGIEVMRHLVNVHTHIVGIIVITGYGSLKLAREFMHLGTENILPVDFISKPFSPSELIEEVKHTLNIIRLKRSKQGSLFEREIKMRLDSIDQKLQQLNSLVDIRDEVIQTSRRIPGFFAQLGLDIVRILLIALAVLSFLYLGLGDFIRSVIETKP